MNFLYPLLLAGVAAVAMPILLHMIRRRTRKRVTFSSLMFLRTTTPRLRNRSRLEHISLLMLRCSILCLLAFAFARPFLPRSMSAGSAQPDKRIALLVDTSASMKRTGLWEQALQEAKSVLEDTRPSDRVCVMAFDRTVWTLLDFEQWAALDPPRRSSVAMQSLSELSPGWGSTNLGQALVTAAEAIEDDETVGSQQISSLRKVVLIGDCQQGSNLDALLVYEWPERTELTIKRVPCKDSANASLQWVTTRDPLAPFRPGDLPSIRVVNSPDAAKTRFQLRWADDTDTSGSARAADVYVPAGQSLVVPAPARPSLAATKLILAGDDHDFDNTLYVAPPLKQPVTILYVGRDDPNDAKAMLYYVRRAFGAGDTSVSRVIPHAGDEPPDERDIAAANLVIVADSMTQPGVAPLRNYLESGRTVLFVIRSAEAASTLGALMGVDNLQSREAEVGRYAMLDSIDFKHPLLMPFSDPRFGDFTRIHFWKYRQVNIVDQPNARVLARFDSNDPAWFEMPVGRGSLIVWTSGWQPSDSDMALSSKFVPLLYSVLEHGGTLADRRSQYFVGDIIPLPAAHRIRRPDNSAVSPEGEQQSIMQADLPGIYAMESPTGNRAFAVNLSPDESRTEPMAIEDIEKLGVPLEPVSDVASGLAGQATRHSSFVEMESRQKLWRWVLVATLVVLLVETWLSGWLIRSGAVPEGEQP